MPSDDYTTADYQLIQLRREIEYLRNYPPPGFADAPAAKVVLYQRAQLVYEIARTVLPESDAAMISLKTANPAAERVLPVGVVKLIRAIENVIQAIETAVALQPSVAETMIRRMALPVSGSVTPLPPMRHAAPAAPPAPRIQDDGYISIKRIEALREASTAQFDTLRLVALLESINDNLGRGDYIAAVAVQRVVLDHVAPVFGHETFRQVAAHQKKSTKAIFERLDQGLRDIADHHLHRPIEAGESLPTRQQVDFRQEFDHLVEAVLRLLSANTVGVGKPTIGHAPK